MVANHTEGPQIIVDKDINLLGLGMTSTTVHMDGSTTNSGDTKGWFLVNDGVTFNMNDLTLDVPDIWFSRVSEIMEREQLIMSSLTISGTTKVALIMQEQVFVCLCGTPTNPMNVTITNCQFTV